MKGKEKMSVRWRLGMYEYRGKKAGKEIVREGRGGGERKN